MVAVVTSVQFFAFPISYNFRNRLGAMPTFWLPVLFNGLPISLLLRAQFPPNNQRVNVRAGVCGAGPLPRPLFSHPLAKSPVVTGEIRRAGFRQPHCDLAGVDKHPHGLFFRRELLALTAAVDQEAILETAFAGDVIQHRILPA